MCPAAFRLNRNRAGNGFHTPQISRQNLSVSAGARCFSRAVGAATRHAAIGRIAPSKSHGHGAKLTSLFLTKASIAGQSNVMTQQADTNAAATAQARPDTALQSLTFEAAMGELETIVRRLESGDVSLEESVSLYERGHALRQHCEARLAAAQARIEQVSLGADGRPTGAKPFGDN